MFSVKPHAARVLQSRPIHEAVLHACWKSSLNIVGVLSLKLKAEVIALHNRPGTLF